MEKRTIGSWSFAVSPQVIQHTQQVNDQALDLIDCWVRHFPHEKTWVQKEFSLPSLLIRLDMVVKPDGTIGVFEVEERPGGLALNAILSASFKAELRQLFREWEEVAGRSIDLVVSNERRSGDEEVTGEELGIRVHKGVPTVDSGALYLVRAEPGEVDFHHLQDRCVSTLLTKGAKSYGVPLGLWRPVPETPAELPWKIGFVLKPCQSSKMRGMYLYHPAHPKGSIDRKEAEALVRRRRVQFVQDWIEPEHHDFLPPDHFLNRRIFWGWSPREKRWKCIGGLWNARPNVRLHGASDAIFGAVEVV